MHSLSFDGDKNLVVRYEKTGNYEIDYEIDAFLIEAGFVKKSEDDTFIIYVYTKEDPVIKIKTINWTVTKFTNVFGQDDALHLDEKIQNVLVNFQNKNEAFEKARQDSIDLKKKTEYDPEIPNFNRKLLPYQKESVEHLLTVGNGANFSVPGSGKTTIAYAAIAKWLDDNVIEKIFVIGPTASFVPWEEEFESCFGRPPRCLRCRGPIVDELPNIGNSFELFLMHYSTAMNRIMEINNFLANYNTVLIIDESHWIKNPNMKRYAQTALSIAPNAKRRIILSGTPMPNDARDLWTQLTFLWPLNYPLGNQIQYNDYVQKRGIGRYKDKITPWFNRITKVDLDLPKPIFKNYRIDLGPIQREIYDVIAAKTLQEIQDANIREQSKLQKFRIAKMVRLLQTASNPSMLEEHSHDLNVDPEEYGLSEQKIKVSGIKDLKIYDKIYLKMDNSLHQMELLY